MAVTVIVEDGTLVANANSFVTSADVSAYCDARGYAFGDDDTDPDDLKRWTIRAGDYLKNTQRFLYTGALITPTQTMPWPRTGANMYRGPAIPENVVPQCEKDAQCELAYRAAQANLQPDLARGGKVKREKVDVIETEWFESAPAETVITAVMGILAPVLLSGQVYTDPYVTSPIAHEPWRPNEFGNPAATYPTDPPATS